MPSTSLPCGFSNLTLPKDVLLDEEKLKTQSPVSKDFDGDGSDSTGL